MNKYKVILHLEQHRNSFTMLFTFTQNTQEGNELFSNYRHDILIRHNVRKPNTLGNMSSTRPPNHRILERLLQRAMDLIADILDRRVVPDDQGLGEIGVFSFSATVSFCYSLRVCSPRGYIYPRE